MKWRYHVKVWGPGLVTAMPALLLVLVTVAGAASGQLADIADIVDLRLPAFVVQSQRDSADGGQINLRRAELEVRTRYTWREDWRCGPDYPLEDGTPATCYPILNFCCSAAGWCGETAEHCTCSKCVDYRSEPGENGHCSGLFSSSEDVIIPKFRVF